MVEGSSGQGSRQDPRRAVDVEETPATRANVRLPHRAEHSATGRKREGSTRALLIGLLRRPAELDDTSNIKSLYPYTIAEVPSNKGDRMLIVLQDDAGSA